MAGRGPAPKPAELRRRRNAPTHAETLLPRHTERLGPELPKGYSDQTVSWYETWRTSPQATAFEATDWLRLLMLAPIVNAYFVRPGAAALSEIRLNEERLGATYVDRQRARMSIEPLDDGEPAAPVVSLVDTRKAIAERARSGS